MSEVEYLKGKLIPVDLKGTLEETAKFILEENGQTKNEYCSTYLEQLEDWGYQNFYVSGNKLFRVEMSETDPYDDIFDISKSDNSSYEFTLKYYNGGCGFSEALDTAFDRLVEK